jgi:hypothetical protein
MSAAFELPGRNPEGRLEMEGHSVVGSCVGRQFFRRGLTRKALDLGCRAEIRMGLAEI